MKTIFTNFMKMKVAKIWLLCWLFSAMAFVSKAQITGLEDFENETVGATSFTTDPAPPISFNTTFPIVTYPGGFGYNNSLKFLEIFRTGVNTSASATISLNTGAHPGVGYKINSFAAYTSNSNGGTTPYNGILTISGTPVGGGPVLSASLNVGSASGVLPAGQTREANGMVNGINLNGTPLAGLYFTTLTFTIVDTDLNNGNIGTGYLGLDHISFTTEAAINNNYAIGNISYTEGNAGTTIQSYSITRSVNTLAGSVQIQSGGGTATAGNDYVAVPLTTVNFTAGGSLTQTVNVTINGDVTIEPNETFNMTLSNPIGGTITTGTGVITILDDDQNAEIFDDEINNALTFSQNGNNFTTTGKLKVHVGGNFGAGGSTGYAMPNEPYATGNQGSFQITSPGKSFYVTSVDLWSAVVSGSAPNWVYTPTNCTVTFTGAKFDGTGTVTHSAAITPTGVNGHFTVNFAGSPLANVNLLSLSFSVPSPITYLQIDNFKYGITTSNAVQVSINDVSVLEGTGGGSNSATFTISRTNNTTSFTVDAYSSAGTAAEGVDYTAFPTTILTFTSGGALSQTVSVPILKDATIEGNETFNMNLINITNGALYLKQVGIGTILDDDKICETFDTDVHNETTFAENGITFSATNRFKVVNSGNPNGDGSNTSPGFLIATNGAIGSMGKMILTSPNKAFKLNSLDVWASSNGTTAAPGNVTFTATLFGGGTVTTTKAIASNSGNGWHQNVLFTGTPLDNVLLTEIEVISLSPLTEVDIDNFCYSVFNTVPIIEVADAGNVAITNGGAASLGNNTDFGGACVTGGSVSKTYTIKNTGAVNLTLSGLPVSVGGADASHFTISTQPTTPIIPGGSSTFTVVFDPSSAGVKNANISFTNNDATNTPFVVNIKGTGNANPDATITANNSVCQNSPLNLSVPPGASAYIWSGNGMPPNSTLNAVTATPLAIGSQTYSVTVTSGAGCTSTGSKNVTINAQPMVNAGVDQTICEGSSANILGQCIYNVYGTLSGAAEVPAVASNGTGYVVGTFNTITNLLTINVVYSGLTSNASNAHIHGPAAFNVGGAGVLVGLTGFVTGATSGTYTNTFTLTATNAGYLTAGNTYVNIHSVNFPGGELRAQLTASCAADNFVWNPGNISGIGATVSPTTIGANTYTLTATNSTSGCSNTSSVTINVDNVTLPTAATTNLQNVGNVPLVANGCEYVAKVTPTAGFTDATVKSWVETIPPYLYVPRHFEITPSTNSSTATGMVTLYYSQTDFNTYNGSVTTGLLPTGPADVSGIANFEILKYAGTSPTGTGYTGTPILIPGIGNAWNTGAYTFVWNAVNEIWEVTFPVTGFSGFLAKSTAQPLPINLISFTGKNTEKGNLLNWKTANEKNFSHFEIERSIDAKKFEKINNQIGNVSENYELLDSTPPSGAGGLYYRLKMIDLDGSFRYSKIVFIENSAEKFLVGNFYPNPSLGKSFIEITATESGNWNITSFDLIGKIINSEIKYLQKGLNKFSIEKLIQGVNFVRFENGKISEIRKLIKE